MQPRQDYRAIQGHLRALTKRAHLHALMYAHTAVNVLPVQLIADHGRLDHVRVEEVMGHIVRQDTHVEEVLIIRLPGLAALQRTTISVAQTPAARKQSPITIQEMESAIRQKLIMCLS